ncbi:hypothetical protein AAMO2058_000950000 [Amorphochlora amoebiformis]
MGGGGGGRVRKKGGGRKRARAMSVSRGSILFYHSDDRKRCLCEISRADIPNKPQSSNDKNPQALWNLNLGKCIDASPLVVACACRTDDIEANTVVIGSHSGKFLACNAVNGEPLWALQLPDRIESTAAISRDMEQVYVGCDDSKFYSINAFSGSIEWSVKGGDHFKATPTVDANTGYVWIGCYDKHLYVLNAREKRILAKIPFKASIFAPVIIQRKIAIAVNLKGNLAVLDTHSFQKLANIDIGAPVFATPCVTAHHELSIIKIATVTGKILCYNLNLSSNPKTLTASWDFKTPSNRPIFSPPTALPRPFSAFMVFGCHDGHVRCLDSAGQLLWTIEGRSEVAGGFCVRAGGGAGETVLGCYARRGGEVGLVCIDGGNSGRDGIVARVFSSWMMKGEVFAAPVWIGQMLFVACRDDKLWCYWVQKS